MLGLGQMRLIAKTGAKLPQRIEVARIENSAADKIVIRHHYLHRRRTGGLQLSHGVFFDGVMSGVLVWASPTFHHFKGLIPPLHQKEVVELARFWLSDTMPYNSETATLKQGMKALKRDWLTHTGYRPAVVVSYSDAEVGHEGTIYKAANFRCWGFAKSARLADIDKGYSRNREKWKTDRYTGDPVGEDAPRSSGTKRMWVYFLRKVPGVEPR